MKKRQTKLSPESMEAFQRYWASSVSQSVITDYETGNVVEIKIQEPKKNGMPD